MSSRDAKSAFRRRGGWFILGAMTEIVALRALVSGLKRARSFEEAAGVALRAMLATASSALSTSRYAGRGHMLRGMAHLRPEDGYRRLSVEEHNEGRSDISSGTSPASIETAYLPSATAYRWIAEHGEPVAIDVQAGLLHPSKAGEAPIPESTTGPGMLRLGSDETRDRLLGRDATHVCVLPLCAPGGPLVGMFSLEASCHSAMGRAFVWEACLEHLSLLADLSAPHLLALPLRPAPRPEPEELLPVTGASTAGLVQILRVFAQQEETLLIGGPTGVGKSRLARYCHARSRRHAERFEVLDLLTVPEELQMGELFGWKKGAFTGAASDTPGAIARAEKGTLFIDEIDKLSLKVQASLLRVLEERVYRPMGDKTADRHANVRFLIGTNADLQAAVRSGAFREDLYYRINVLPVKVPPLSARTDEIPAWSRYMLERRHREGGGAGTSVLTEEAERLLARSSWPGNLRQLDNIVRRAYALSLTSGPALSGVELTRRHVEQALAYEVPADTAPLLDELRRAARAFVREAERRPPDAALSFDHASAFPGLVLSESIARAGGRDEAFRLLGRADLLENRNHHRVLHREMERAARLLEALGARPEDLPLTRGPLPT